MGSNDVADASGLALHSGSQVALQRKLRSTCMTIPPDFDASHAAVHGPLANVTPPATTDMEGTKAALLDDLQRYRADLAQILRKNNPQLDRDLLTEIVQRILDRLIFLRFLEDRFNETEYRVHDFTRIGEGKNWPRFLAASLHLDTRYQGLVFKKHVILDGGALVVTDRDFAHLCSRLSHSQSPYDFTRMPFHILGSIYERFLGTVIPTSAHCIRAETQPKGRKARGVYYTPKPIVRYVCAQTIAPIIAGKTPMQIERMRFADLACGSGNFLLGILDLLLRYHRDWYAAHPEAARKENLAPAPQQQFIPAVEERDGLLRLTIEKKQQILLNSVYGIDSDPHALEVAQCTLFLKLLEDEPNAGARNDGPGQQRSLLPPLIKNLKCGNTLIEADFFQQVDSSALTSTERKAINPFSFEKEFAWTQENRGFDAVVGNPPWGQKEIGKDKEVQSYLRRKYPSSTGIFDLFRAFVERGIELTKPGGFWGMVLPDIVLLKDYQPTRELLLRELTLAAVDWWGMKFAKATIDAATIIGIRSTPRADHKVRVAIHDPAEPLEHEIPQSDFAQNARCTFNLRMTSALRRATDFFHDQPRLGDFFEIHEGIHSGNIRDELFVSTRLDDSCQPLIFGRDELAPFRLRWNGRFVRLSAFPITRTKERYANSGRPEWYCREKVLVRRTGDRVIAAVDRKARYVSNNFFLIFSSRPCHLSLSGLVALLNSDVITWFFRAIEPRKGRAFAEIKIKHLEAFPLPPAILDAAACARLNKFGEQLEKRALESDEGVRSYPENEEEVRRLFGVPNDLVTTL